jgi:malate synthase
VEITGPVERKMIINALNSGAKIFMADFEDANSPTWENVLEGQLNLQDAIRRKIDFKHASTGKKYTLNQKTAVLVIRPRGWHLVEKHLLIDREPERIYSENWLRHDSLPMYAVCPRPLLPARTQKQPL